MIEVIAGTNRPGARTLLAAQYILGVYQKLGIEARLLSLADLPPEIFNPKSYGEKPMAFVPIAQRVLDAAGLHVVTPEYNGSFPGVLKYFIDMLKFPESFERKPVAFLGLAAGMWGALRSVEQLTQIFGYRNAFILPTRVFVPKVGQAMADDGTWLDETLPPRIEEQCAAFAKFIAAVR